MRAKIDEFFRMMAEHNASDLHLISGQLPVLRIDGELERIAGQAVLTQDTLHPLLDEIMPGSKKDQFESTGDVDFGYEIPGLARFRCNCFNHKYGLGAVFRKIPSKILTAEELARIIHEHFCFNRGFAATTSLRRAGSPFAPSTYC